VGILVGVDHGGSTTTALALSTEGPVVGRHSLRMPRQMPNPGWVEHDAEDFLVTSVSAIRGALDDARRTWRDVEAIGLANQGETTIAWDAVTGRPLGPSLSWQDRRTTEYCAGLVEAGHDATVRTRTGLPIDPYFSASKIRWLLDASEPARDALARGRLRVGGSDAFVMYRLTGGEVHATDPSTAARTALMNLARRTWDSDVAEGVFEIPVDVLPEIRPSTGRHFSQVKELGGLGPIPITADVVDANAALFAQGCFSPDIVKATYGTGAFVAASVGADPVLPQNGLLPFVGWQIASTTTYTVEGGVFDVGTAIDWLVQAGLVASPAATEQAAGEDTGGVVMVPSFSGLAAPMWQPRARAAILGMTLDTTPGQLVRATLEGIACSVADIVAAMEASTATSTSEVRVDGGPTRNAVLMQVQADLIGRPISVSQEPDLTALGAAVLAGVGVGALTMDDALALPAPRTVYEPALADDERLDRLLAWHTALETVGRYSESRPHPESR
jgi:glycerol kinase